MGTVFSSPGLGLGREMGGPGPRRLAEGEGTERKGQQIGRRQREHALEPWTPWSQKARQILTNILGVMGPARMERDRKARLRKGSWS